MSLTHLLPFSSCLPPDPTNEDSREICIETEGAVGKSLSLTPGYFGSIEGCSAEERDEVIGSWRVPQCLWDCMWNSWLMPVLLLEFRKLETSCYHTVVRSGEITIAGGQLCYHPVVWQRWMSVEVWPRDSYGNSLGLNYLTRRLPW